MSKLVRIKVHVSLYDVWFQSYADHQFSLEIQDGCQDERKTDHWDNISQWNIKISILDTLSVTKM